MQMQGSAVIHARTANVERDRCSVVDEPGERCLPPSEEVAGLFPVMTLFIDMRRDANPDLVQQQQQQELAMYCPISKLVRASDTVLNERWSVSPL